MALERAKSATIAAEEHESYVILPGRADAGLVILCDHAGNAFPPGYGTLGLPTAQLLRHIAYDIGAAAITRMLSEWLGVPALLTRYSRLLIDPNRGCDDPTLIMRLSDGAVIPGNRRLISEFKHGRLAPPDDPAGLARVIAEQWADFDRAVTMGRAARSRVEQEFSIRIVARKHLELFQSLVIGH